jgi:hypothetical protein
MIKLKRVGFFKELGHGDEQGQSLKASIADTPQEHEAEILYYLEHGILFIATPGIVFDVLANSRKIIGAPHILTDGIWAWPKDLVYYVKKYHCRLPEDFVEHMKSRNWEPPTKEEVDFGSISI